MKGRSLEKDRYEGKKGYCIPYPRSSLVVVLHP